MEPAWWGHDPRSVAPDGSFWAGWMPADGDDGWPDGCDGLSRFDGLTPVRYLPGMRVSGMDIAADGSVWLTAVDEADEERLASRYVVTSDAVAAAE